APAHTGAGRAVDGLLLAADVDRGAACAERAVGRSARTGSGRGPGSSDGLGPGPGTRPAGLRAGARAGGGTAARPEPAVAREPRPGPRGPGPGARSRLAVLQPGARGVDPGWRRSAAVRRPGRRGRRDARPALGHPGTGALRAEPALGVPSAARQAGCVASEAHADGDPLGARDGGARGCVRPARPRAAAFAALALPERCDARSPCRSAGPRPRSVGRRCGAPGEWLCGARRLPGSIDRLHPGGADVVTGNSLAAVRSNGPSKEEE